MGTSLCSGAKVDSKNITKMVHYTDRAVWGRSKELVRKTERLVVEEGSPQILLSWTLLLGELAEDLAEVESNMADLRARLSSKELLYQQDLAYFEDVQAEMEDCYKRSLEKEQKKAKKSLECLTRELEEKEEELARAMEIRSELMGRIGQLLRKNGSFRVKKSALIKEKERLEEELERERQEKERLMTELEEARMRLKEESEECFKEGVRLGRKIAAQEERGVLEELEILQDIERCLLEALDERMENSDSEVTVQLTPQPTISLGKELDMS